MSTDRSTIWRRRLVLMAIVGLIVAIPLTIALRGDEEPAPAPEPVVEAPALGDVDYNRDVGAELRLPEGWTEKKRKDVLVLQSADKRARIAISSPGPKADADQLLDEVIAGFKNSYSSFEVTERSDRSSVGGLEATTTAARGQQKKSGEEVGLLISTAKGDKRAYLVVVFTPITDPGESAVEAQAILNELELVG